MGRRILVVEDNLDLAELVSMHLRDAGYACEHCSDGQVALQRLQTQPFDLVILDLMLPGLDGLEVCRRLRARADYLPILMLTAKSSELDRVLGLEVGADDYVTKPFSPRILVARIRAVLRRADGSDDAVGQLLRVGGLTIDIDRHEVQCGETHIELSATEFALLEFLARHEGLVFSRERIISAVKGEDYPVTERSVDVQVLGLRRKLGQCANMLVTVRGVGYKIGEE